MNDEEQQALVTADQISSDQYSTNVAGSTNTEENDPTLNLYKRDQSSFGTTVFTGPYFTATLLSSCFLFIFISFSATQNLVTSLVPGNLGFWSLAVLYAFFCFGALFVSSAATDILKPKVAMIIGGATYLGYMAANLHPVYWTLLPGAALLGVGASLLWAGEGSYLTVCAIGHSLQRQEPLKASLGEFQGLFFGIFQINQIVGNLLSSLVLSHVKDPKVLFYIFLGIAAVGILMMFFLRNLKPKKSAEQQTVPLARRLINAVTLLKDKRALLLIGIFMYTGLENGFIFGIWTKKVIQASCGSSWIGYVMTAFGVADAIASYVLGKVSDRYGKHVILMIGTASHIIYYAFLVIYINIAGIDSFAERKYLLFILAAIYGVGDAVLGCIFPNIITAYYFTTRTEDAFSNLKFWQSAGFILSFILGPLLELTPIILIEAAFVTVGTILVFVLDRFVEPMDVRRASSS